LSVCGLFAEGVFSSALATGADTCCKGGGKRLGGAGLAVLLPAPRLLLDLRAAACSAFCFASASACCAIAAQVLSLITFHIANASAALVNSVNLMFPPLPVFISSNTVVKVIEWE
jgi:hypothetical protein